MTARSSTIGLYIGIETADLVQLGGSFQHPRLVHYASVSLPGQGAWRKQMRAEEGSGQGTGPSSPSGLEQTEQNVSNAIATLFQKVGVAPVKVYTAIAPEAIVIRYFQMPNIPPQERKVAIAFEAKKYLPFKLEELATDSQILVHRANPELMRIMFFGIKKTALSAYLSILQSAGGFPLSLEAVPVSLLRLLRQTGQLPTEQVAAILCLEKDSAIITIASDRLLYLSRNVSITETAGSPQGVVSPELLEAMVNETRVSIDYYRRRFLGEPAVRKVVIYGPNIDPKRAEELTAALDIPVEVGNPFKRIAGTKETPGGLAVAVGLALRGLEKKSGECNLLPAEHRYDLQSLLKPSAVEVSVATLLLGFAYFAALGDLSSWEQKISALWSTKAAVSSVKPTAPLTDLQTLQTQQQKQLRFMREIAATSSRYTQLLSELSHLLPQEAYVRYALLEDYIALKEPNENLPVERRILLKLAGAFYAKDQAKEFEGVNNFLASLRSSPPFKQTFRNFNLDSVQRGQLSEEDLSEFRLTCSSNPQETKGEPRYPLMEREEKP